VAERTRALKAASMGSSYGTSFPAGSTWRTLSTHRAACIVRGIRPQGASARVRRRLASEIMRLASGHWSERSRT
jgi:hypothetical protein